MVAVISADGVDAKRVLKAGGVEIKLGKDSNVEAKYGSGANFRQKEIGSIGGGIEFFSTLDLKLEFDSSNQVKWGGGVKFFSGKAKIGLSGSFEFDVIGAAKSGMVGRALQKHRDQIP